MWNVRRLKVNCALIWLASGVAFAQTFEVATIKPNNSGDPGSYTNSRPGEISLRNNPLKSIIEDAFDVRDFSFSGPAWLNSIRFDVTAKIPAWATIAQRDLMMQALVKERFGLAVHHETKTLQGYSLVLARDGFKVQPVLNDGKGEGGWDAGPGRITARQASVPRFADRLARQLESPVSDETAIKGFYNFTLRYTEPGTDGPGPSIFTAIQEQLGLKLESRKVPVDVLVVDHVERVPTAN
jgi:uncharacterized protein (TIGR03435 family)